MCLTSFESGFMESDLVIDYVNNVILHYTNGQSSQNGYICTNVI